MLFSLVNLVLNLYELGLLAYVFCAWIAHPVAQILRLRLAAVYEPALAPIRRWLFAPQIGGTLIDLSPLFLYFAVGVIRWIVIALLR